MHQANPLASRAVLIGVGKYEEMPPLPTVATGVRKLKRLLTDPALWGLPAEHCVVLSNPATSDQVLEAVQAAARAATDTLLVYFAGHGCVAGDGDLCLMLPKAPPDGLYGVVRYRDLREVLLSDRRAENQVMVLDCCHSGAAVTGYMGPAAELANRTVIDRTYLMTACAKGEASYAPPDETYPAFTGDLIRTLEDGVPGAPDPVPMADVFTQMRDALRAKNRPDPQDRATGLGHKIALVRNRAVDATPDTGHPGPWVPPRPPRQKPPSLGARWRWTVTAALVVSIAALAFLWPLNTPETGSRFGDHRSADPCALTVPAALGRFGHTAQDVAYGNFDRCDVLVERAGGDEVDVMVDLDNGQEATTAATKTEGRVKVVKQPAESNKCVRLLLPADDDVTVAVVAKTDDNASAPLCEIADVAADNAVAVLNKGELPRRTTTFPEDSLFHSDACALLDAKALEAVPGVDANAPTPGFGNWLCKFWSTTSHLQVGLRFDRGQSPTAADGTPTRIRGRRAFVQPEVDGENMVRVRVVQRTYSDGSQRTLSETLDVTVRGDRDWSADELRRLATRLADAAAANLPATR
ncbi:caspase family protein [Streptomyces sp. NBC_00878]|uniref:caspase family protein n=1 Tax=Streptomyces sp. NBC_00878 TaxID=2975854 RepID=UPI0022588CC6|nr:caspase family protein [Streptomyces sp. NBC_00878]MCX4904479.1 caspase family protein [Streptomyces sp. NBC_00878]